MLVRHDCYHAEIVAWRLRPSPQSPGLTGLCGAGPAPADGGPVRRAGARMAADSRGLPGVLATEGGSVAKTLIGGSKRRTRARAAMSAPRDNGANRE